MTDSSLGKASHSWKESFAVYLKPQVLVMLFLGFSAGLPFLLVFSTLITWLKSVGLSIATVGYFSFIGITYSIKIFWAPIVDFARIPFLTRRLGHRRSWVLVAQIGIGVGLLLMAMTNPAEHPIQMAFFALLVAFSSATQDISIDAFRIESASSDYQAAMSSTYILGYRIAVLVSFAGALYIADMMSWHIAYLMMALLVSVGIVTVLLIKEPAASVNKHTLMPEQQILEHIGKIHPLFRGILSILIFPFLTLFVAILLFFVLIFPVGLIWSILSDIFSLQFGNLDGILNSPGAAIQILLGVSFVIVTLLILLVAVFKHQPHLQLLRKWLFGAIIGPFVDFFHRFGIPVAAMVLSLIAIYRITDIFMSSMASTLYVELGFQLSEIATITKLFGFFMTLAGAALGGVLVMRFGLLRPLLLGAILVVISNLLFSVMSTMGNDITWLTIVIAGDNISAGLAQSAFIAYLSALVNKSYTATQYALFSSIMTLLGKTLSGFSGEIVESHGYFDFFILASILGIPTILLITALIMMKHDPRTVDAETTNAER